MQKFFKYISLLFLFTGLNNISFSQVLFDYTDISIFFGDKNKSGSSVHSLERTKSDELLCVQNKLSFFQIFAKNNSRYTFDLITDYSLPKSKPIQFYGEGEKTNLINYTHIGNQVLGLSYRTAFLDQTPELFYHYIDPLSGGKSNHGFPIASFNTINKEIDLSRILMISSQDASYSAILHIPKTKPEDYTNIKYIILKEDYSVRIENEFIYPYPSGKYEPLDYFVFDEKDQILLTGHYVDYKKEGNWSNTHTFFEHISITKITNNQLSFEHLKTQGKFFTDVEAYNHEEGIIIISLYSSYIDGQIEGTYIALVDQNGKVKTSHFIPFSMDVINSLKSFKENYFSNQMQVQTEYRKFNILDFKILDDGYLFSAEFNAVEYRYGGTDVPGATNIIDTYYWSSDLIICKIDKNGQLIWDKVIPKIQRSINDGGYYLSTSSYSDDTKLHLFFNDNLSNYNEDGVYSKDGEIPLPVQFSSSKNTIAHVSIQLNNGKVQRKSTLGKSETKVLFVPRLSVAFENAHKLMIYGQSGNKHRVGSVSFLR